MLVLKGLALLKLMKIILICSYKLLAYTPNVGLHSLIFFCTEQLYLQKAFVARDLAFLFFIIFSGT